MFVIIVFNELDALKSVLLLCKVFCVQQTTHFQLKKNQIDSKSNEYEYIEVLWAHPFLLTEYPKIISPANAFLALLIAAPPKTLIKFNRAVS